MPLTSLLSDRTERAPDHFEHHLDSNGNRQLYVAQAEDAAQLILSGFGMYLGKKSERLQVKLGGKALYEFPFFRISEVVVASRGVSLSSDLLKEFCERGIRLTFVEASGRPYAMLSSPVLTATVESRREQLLAYNDERGLDFARLIVRGKIRNQRHLLLYFGKYLKQSDAERFGSSPPSHASCAHSNCRPGESKAHLSERNARS